MGASLERSAEVRGATWDERSRDIYVYRDPVDGTVTVSYADSLSKNDVRPAADDDPYLAPF